VAKQEANGVANAGETLNAVAKQLQAITK